MNTVETQCASSRLFCNSTLDPNVERIDGNRACAVPPLQFHVIAYVWLTLSG